MDKKDTMGKAGLDVAFMGAREIETSQVRSRSGRSIKGTICYEIRQLGAYLSILDFDMNLRHMRRVQDSVLGSRMIWIDKIRVMVFFPF